MREQAGGARVQEPAGRVSQIVRNRPAVLKKPLAALVQTMVIPENLVRRVALVPMMVIPENPMRHAALVPTMVIPANPVRLAALVPMMVIPENPARRVALVPMMVIPENPARRVAPDLRVGLGRLRVGEVDHPENRVGRGRDVVSEAPKITFESWVF